MEEPSAAEPRRTSVTQVLVVLGVLLLVLLIAIPGFLSSGRMSNDQMAASRLRTLTSAEADFRSNDRDGNHVNDYWTGDVKSLYTLTSAERPGAKGGPEDPPMKLIDLRLAWSDADGRKVEAGGENTDLSRYGAPDFRYPYWFAALERDLSEQDPRDVDYRQDTGGTPLMGSCHHPSKFGFVAFPDSQSAGPGAFIVNEHNTVYQTTVAEAIRTGKSVPPGRDGFQKRFQDWPSEADLKSRWTKRD